MATSSPADSTRVTILFVCLGNICRSPTAHGVFQSMVDDADLSNRVRVYSAGTGDWHAGEPPDDRAQRHAYRRGYDLSDLRARHLSKGDLALADLVLAMDRANLAAIRGLSAPKDVAKARLLLDFAPDQPVREVPDPYSGGAAGFEKVLDLVETACRGLLAHVRMLNE